ncbi:phage shock protein C (PspC) family protein [Pseudonocardia ammonioxydans]|uniref:Phage shock protein C (PspC) family protein n=1 Tax=Pseudonocardia ammonioxydans TaxID=260086 RepID=A0A1I4SC19_PSUAM|nr:PspC domain-containing protein [Pseudonocardia ammonioxydans]SFM62019.1 phage shock protein C (PspC) family protein [Pseudonocardia ammonioxydans]
MDIAAQNTTTSSSTGPAAGAAGAYDPTAQDAVGAGGTTGAPEAAGSPGTSGSAGGAAAGLGDRLAAYRMRRSTTDKMLGGVCGGLARDLGADVALLRVIVLVLTLVTGGAAALVYLAAWLVAPAE